MDKFRELKAAAMAATPGRIGDRIDGSGSIKYECTGYDGSLVLRTNHKDMEYGFVGDNADADELFFRLCVPDVVLELLAELEAKDKRIAELEAIRADASQVLKEIGNELGCNPDNESIMMAIDALKEREKRVVALAGGNADLWETMAARLEAAEAKLATPVRLKKVDSSNVPYAGDGFNAAVDYCADAVRAAGFTVVVEVGDD